MRDSRAEARRWLAQARSDLAFAELGAREGFHAQCCFLCQQAAEKALKALHYARGARVVLGHSLVALLAPLLESTPDLAPLGDPARELDQFYVPTRYPNGLPGGTPSEHYTARQSREALASARGFLDAAGTAIDAD